MAGGSVVRSVSGLRVLALPRIAEHSDAMTVRTRQWREARTRIEADGESGERHDDQVRVGVGLSNVFDAATGDSLR